MKLQSGSKVALVGPSGGGKVRLVSLKFHASFYSSSKREGELMILSCRLQ